MTEPRYHVVEEKGWYYIVRGEKPTCASGPWRYRWEAQEYADNLNAVRPDRTKP